MGARDHQRPAEEFMHMIHRVRFGLLVRVGLIACLAGWLAGCSGSHQPRLTGVAYEYDSAKDMLKKGRFDKALEFSEAPAMAVPPNEFTLRAQALQVAVYSGMIRGYGELADAYTKGAETTKNIGFKTAYERQRNDALQYGSRLGLALAQLSHHITEFKSLEKEYTLDAPYPSQEAPLTLPELARVREGGWIDPDEQVKVGKDALLKGVNDSLASMLASDRTKARTALAAGPVKIDGADFGLFLGKELHYAATLFDRKHLRDSAKLRLVCGEATEVADIVAAMLKQNPNKDREKALKKLQDDIKNTLRVL
jgi:hypothetical protein